MFSDLSSKKVFVQKVWLTLTYKILVCKSKNQKKIFNFYLEHGGLKRIIIENVNASFTATLLSQNFTGSKYSKWQNFSWLNVWITRIFFPFFFLFLSNTFRRVSFNFDFLSLKNYVYDCNKILVSDTRKSTSFSQQASKFTAFFPGGTKI